MTVAATRFQRLLNAFKLEQFFNELDKYEIHEHLHRYT